MRLASVFHIHTSHSFDCMSSPAGIVKWAKRNGIGVLGITDHNTIQGAQEAAASSKGSGVQVIVGAEYESTNGDVIGLFLKEEIRSSDPFQIIDAIRNQGGISILPHPYHGHSRIEELAQAVDMIEVFNARCSESQNRQALELATSLKKPKIGGADAHFIKDIKSCICYLAAGHPIMPDDLLTLEINWAGNRTPKTGIYWSQAIKGLKIGDRALMKSHLQALLAVSMKKAIGEGMYRKLRNVIKAKGTTSGRR
jgi:predicted metal-dependent phosphoesterase TrpH